MKQINIKNLGFSKEMSTPEIECGAYLGRVISQAQSLYHVLCENGEIIAEVSGKFHFETKNRSAFPAVGDFVLLDRDDNHTGNAIISCVLPRKSAFIRKAAGRSHEEQVIASNIDLVFICMSLNQDFNLRRLERYLSIGWESGALPVVLLTKADLCNDVASHLYEVSKVALGVEVLVVSMIQEKSCQQIASLIEAGQTAVLIGSSGVGKSTLTNHLIGEERLATGQIREDAKGRHTTTRRELILLPNGGMIIDTPGMRELGMENADVTTAFADIDELASACRFHDCSHSGEPGCAVGQAITDGVLDAKRLLNYQKLRKEAKYEGMTSREIEDVKIKAMFGGKNGKKQMSRHLKEKYKRR